MIKKLTLVLAVVLLLYLFSYGVVYSEVHSFVLDRAASFYWINRKTVWILATVVSAVISTPILFALGRSFFDANKPRDYALFAIVGAATLAGQFFDREKFFAKDRDPTFICAAAHPDDSPTLEHFGEGEAKGRRCIRITPENVGVARSLQTLRAPKQIRVSTREELEGVQWFRGGVAAVYHGSVRERSGLPKLFDGPGFDPDSLEFLRAVTPNSVPELIASFTPPPPPAAAPAPRISGPSPQVWKFRDSQFGEREAGLTFVGPHQYAVDFVTTCGFEACTGYVLCSVLATRSTCIEEPRDLVWKTVQKIPPLRMGETIHIQATMPGEVLFNSNVDLYFCMGSDAGCPPIKPIHRLSGVGPRL